MKKSVLFERIFACAGWLLAAAVLIGRGPSGKTEGAKDPVPAAIAPKVAQAAPTAAAAEKKKKKAEPAEATERRAEESVLSVKSVSFDGETDVCVVFNRRPDAEVARQYVRIGPVRAGAVCFRYETRYDARTERYEPALHVTGDYLYRTNIELRILKGFPPYGKGATSEGALAEDFTRTFRRRDPKPALQFADDGRYLPPGGRRALRLEAIGITNIATSVRRVEPRNVVQLLSREEGVYRSCRWDGSVDVEETEELSGGCETGLVRCVNRPCERETCLCPVSLGDGGPANGIYLVAVRNADRPRDENSWRDPAYNPNLYRLVCLSDLGLSVRRDSGGLGVWVTSLTTGKPVPDAQVEVYSSANILVGTGQTEANGWCAVKRCSPGEMFALVVSKPEGRDMTFLALRDSMRVDETDEDGARPAYTAEREIDAFVWTDRGIYRHGEKMFVHVLARDGNLRAPKPTPLVLKLKGPKGTVLASKTVLTDADGALADEGFSVPADLPSGQWKILVCLPGKDGKTLAEREVKVEEFAPPQIRVAVRTEETVHPTNFSFAVSAEHLFGAPANDLPCEGAVVFEDVPFAPAHWKGYAFGNDERGLKPSFRRLTRQMLDARGASRFEAPLWEESGRPRAAVRATGQGTVFEDGGRPVTMRKSVVCHYYPFYVGSRLSGWLKRPAVGLPKVDLVCVDPTGKPVAACRQLIGRVERVDSVYSYRKNDDGPCSWTCDRVRTTVAERIEIPVDGTGRATCELPLTACGDYVFTAEDPRSGASFGRTFYLSDWGDDTVRAPLSNPTEVAIRTDKAFYRVGERPRLVVKAPFSGSALMSVLRDKTVYTEVLNLTNATSEIVLRPVERDWAPNADIAISVVQSVAANARHLASCAHGRATVRVRPAERETAVRLSAAVEMADGGGARVEAEVDAAGATAAVVTLVDEGINLLTGEETPDPVGWLSRVRTADHPLFDLYGRILPVADDGLKVSGVKTGGGFGAEMLGRVSPVPTRRFRPLALWQAKVPLTDGRGRAVFQIPEFVGEVRVTAVAYSDRATGAASVRRKVSPKLVMQPDAPRFVAPGDAFGVTLPLRNCGGNEGEVRYAIACREPGRTAERVVLSGSVRLPKGSVTNVVATLRAPRTCGEMSVGFRSEGLDERHAATIGVPVRPAVAWRTKAEVVRLEPGQVLRRTLAGDSPRFAVTVGASPMAELASALEWLAEYPHGCLEQTVSRIFPLIAAGGILNSVSSKATANRGEFVAAGVRRVESMVRENDFVMWPDCTSAPWDREVSLYAAHFLLEAEKAGQSLNAGARGRVLAFLRKWALGTNDCVSAYACQTLALAGRPEKDRMFRLYDRRDRLDSLSRARLARAFAAIRDRTRADALVRGEPEPQSVREAAFRALALTDLDPDDPRIPALVAFLTERRDRQRFAWGTTSDNAHALLAIGEYYRHHPPQSGEVRVGGLRARDSLVLDGEGLCLTNTGTATAFLTVGSRWLKDAAEETGEANGIFLSRRYLRADGTPADLSRLSRGDLLVTELTLTSAVTRVVGDLVVEDLFAGAFEPVHRDLGDSSADWVLRKDARDDRMLVFSKRFKLERGHEAKVRYPVRVVSAGDFVLPGPSVEGMYHPDLHARCVPGRLVVRP